MGCDIHLIVEQRQNDGWHRVPHYDRPCDAPFCENGTLSDKVPNEKMRGYTCYACKGKGHHIQRHYDDRHYDVFAMLANVRNGFGFAGVDTGDGFEPLSDGRGLPADLSSEAIATLARGGYRFIPGEEPLYVGGQNEDDGYEWDNPDRYAADWAYGLGEHSFTWLLYSELLDEDYWALTTKHRGWVDPWNFEIWRRDGKPQLWSASVAGASIEHVSPQYLAHLIDSGDLQWVDPEPEDGSYQNRRYTTGLQRDMADWNLPGGSVGAAIAKPDVRHYALVEWAVTYGEQAKNFRERIADTVAHIGNPDPTDVRLVMGFDS